MGLTFRTGALVDAIYTDSSNKVGIGTSTLTAGIPLSINVATGNNCNVAFQENASDKWYLRNITSSNAFSFYSVAGGAEVMRLSSSGNVGISTTSPAARLDVRVPVESPATGAVALIAGTSNGANDIFRWFDGATQLGVFKNNGNVGIGTSSPIGPLTIAVPATGSAIAATNAQQAYDYSRLRIKHYTDSNIGLSIGYAGANYTYIQACYNEGSTAPLFLNPFGNKITINTTDPGPNAQLISSGDQNDPYPIGAKAESASQGLIGFFNNANGVEGSISIASGVVSYNSFMGSHWSQLQDNSKPEILKGTILEAIDEFCTWEDETNDRLAKIKISDTIESKNVYGVFIDWDNTDNFNDMYVAALGAGYIRVNQNEVVSMGDLLQSNGDGTAKVQSDDIMRSSTIGKVVSTQKIETYADGSYLIAATLHCG